jgi:NADPH:quinone reductase-like Zn-dependent oxidoreductase
MGVDWHIPLQAGQTVIIQAGASAIGQFAIQIAQLLMLH